MLRRLSFSILLSALALAGAGCSKPPVEGPQITRVPETFIFDLNASGAALPLGDRSRGDQRGYFSMGRDDTHASIMITEYPGTTTYDQAVAARAAVKERRRNREFGALETLRIDKRPAWGWKSTQTWKGELSSVKYAVVIPYDDLGVTYVVEFYSSQPRFQDSDLMKETLGSFRVKRAGVNYSAVGLALGLGIAFLAAFRHVRRG